MCGKQKRLVLTLSLAQPQAALRAPWGDALDAVSEASLLEFSVDIAK